MKENNRKPLKLKTRGKKPLMSELLKDTRKYLEQAQQTDAPVPLQRTRTPPHHDGPWWISLLCLIRCTAIWHQLQSR